MPASISGTFLCVYLPHWSTLGEGRATCAGGCVWSATAGARLETGAGQTPACLPACLGHAEEGREGRGLRQQHRLSTPKQLPWGYGFLVPSLEQQSKHQAAPRGWAAACQEMFDNS